MSFLGGDWFGLMAIGGIVLFAVCAVLYSSLAPKLKWIILGALFLRVIATLYYYRLVFGPRGTGDALLYYYRGRYYADYFSRFDFSPMFNSELWFHGRWWGTQFVYYPSGLALSVFGDNPLVVSLFFSLLGFIGLLCFAVVFHRAYPHLDTSRYLAWLVLFPSAAFWTSAIGKEAIVMFGMGLAALGFLARKNGPNWILAGCGLFLVFGIRPQVAAVLMMALVFSQAFINGHRWTLFSTLRLVAVMLAGLFVINHAMRNIGAEGVDDVSGLSGYIEGVSSTASTKGTTVAEQAPGLAGAPIGLFNILFRPLPWELNKATQFMAGMEVIAFWAFAFINRRRLLKSIRGWRADGPLAFALIFALIYATTLGMLVINLGIIVRQRIYIFPCILLLMLAEPVRKEVAARYGRGVPAPVPRPALVRGLGRAALAPGTETAVARGSAR